MYGDELVERWVLGVPFKLEEISSTLKTLRLERELSIRKVSEDTGFSPSFLSRLENGKTSITIRNLIKLLDYYGITMAEALASPVSKEMVFRREERSRVEDVEDVSLELLIDLKGAAMEPILATFVPGAHYKEALEHKGVEFALVLKGEFKFEVEEKSYTLREGDCVYFPGEKSHSWQNLTDSEGSVLMVITPPGV